MESRIEEKWQEEVDASKVAARKLYSDNPGQAFHLNQIIEEVTGIHVCTSEEERKIQLCREAVQDLWVSRELHLELDRALAATPRMGRIEVS